MSGAIDQLGFNVEAKLIFDNTELLLDQEITSINIHIGNNLLTPTLQMSFYAESSLASKLLKPYLVDLTIIERDGRANNKTYISGTFLSLSNTSSMVKREPNLQERVDRMHVHHAYILKDAYTLAYTDVGGMYFSKTLKDIVNNLWSKTEHGSLQLKLGSFENNEKLSSVWVPDLKFGDAIKYISQYYGYYTNFPLIYTDLKQLNIVSVNEIKEDPITLYLRESTEEHETDIDSLKYGVFNLPTVHNNFNMVATTMPKELNIIKHSTTKLFDIEKLDIVSHLRSVDVVQNTDLFDVYLDKNIQPVVNLISASDNTMVIKESLSSILLNTIKPTRINIPDPFRFNHWIVGRKVNVETKHLMHANLDITYYISDIVFNLSNTQNQRWRGSVNVELKTASTRNVEV